MWNAKWGGYPDANFFPADPKLGKLAFAADRAFAIDRAVGGLTRRGRRKPD
jgi:hypothetical protein